jgi:hypothetical protein
MDAFTFYNNCVNWDRNDVHEEGGLCDMIDDARQITRYTFLKHVDRESLAVVERNLGYAPHCKDAILRMANDFHVSYHRSKLHGETVYYFRHSAIEYVFANQRTNEDA